MRDRIVFGVLSAACLAMLLWGLRSGEMPSKITSFRKDRHPILYWGAAATLAFFAVLNMLGAIKSN